MAEKQSFREWLEKQIDLYKSTSEYPWELKEILDMFDSSSEAATVEAVKWLEDQVNEKPAITAYVERTMWLHDWNVHINNDTFNINHIGCGDTIAEAVQKARGE